MKPIYVSIILTTLLILIIIPSVSAIYVTTDEKFTQPSTNGWFNFSESQTLADGYRESTSNSTFPEYWFLTKTTGETFGFHSDLTNFTITDFYTANKIDISPDKSGTIFVYYGDLSEPTVTGETSTADPTLKLMTITSTGSPFTLTWDTTGGGGGSGGALTPNETPTPTPTSTNSIINPIITDDSTVRNFILIIAIAIISVLILFALTNEDNNKKRIKRGI